MARAPPEIVAIRANAKHCLATARQGLVEAKTAWLSRPERCGPDWHAANPEVNKWQSIVNDLDYALTLSD